MGVAEAAPTEREKMLAGEDYDSRDPALLARCHVARRLMQELAACDSQDMAQRRRILSQLLGKVEEGAWIEAPLFVDYGENITVGHNTFINGNCVFLDGNRITIGANVLIGPAVQLYTVSHPLPAHERLKPEGGYISHTRPITIGDNAWIGGGAVILPGVDIGEGAVIGAGSVVTRSIPPHHFAAGNPCRIIRPLEG